jgi:hypothetical protein
LQRLAPFFELAEAIHIELVATARSEALCNSIQFIAKQLYV